jgi:hypothetical protein
MYMGTIGDMKTLERHFAHMAEQGWMIDKIGYFSHRYRAIEPSGKRFFVDFLPQITAFDYPENEDAQDYRRFCEDSGWAFVAANKQFHVFCAKEDAPEPMPIHTDNAIQARIYLKACRKYEAFPYAFLILVSALLFALYLSNGMEAFLSNILIFQMIGFSVFSIGWFWTVGFSILWYRRAKKAAKLDLPLPTANYRLSRARNSTFAACAVVCLVCQFAGVFLEMLGGMPAALLLIFFMPLSGVGVGLWIRRQIDTKRRNRKSNMRIAIFAIALMEVALLGIMGVAARQMMAAQRISDSLENRPALTLGALGITSSPERADTRVKGSVAVPIHYSYWESNHQGNVHTEVYRPANKMLAQGLYGRYANELKKGYSDGIGYDCELTCLTPENAAVWGAETGVAVFNPEGRTSELILLRGKTLLRLSIYGEGIGAERAAEAVRNLWGEKAN